MKILDMTAGNRGVWFDKHYRDCTFVDIRPGKFGNVPPWDRGTGYDLIVFDPPHVNGGANSNISRDYGHHTTKEIRHFVENGARDAHAAAAPDALMAFKWNDHDQKLDSVLKLMSEWWEPLFGQVTSTRTKHSCQTYWVMLRKRDIEPEWPVGPRQSG